VQQQVWRTAWPAEQHWGAVKFPGNPQTGSIYHRYSNCLRCPSVCLLSHTRISPILSDIDLQLLLNSIRKSGLPQGCNFGLKIGGTKIYPPFPSSPHLASLSLPCPFFPFLTHPPFGSLQHKGHTSAHLT